MSRKFLFSITVNNGLVQAVSFDTLTASDLPTDIAYTDVANAFTAAPQTISCNADGNKGLVVKQHSGTQSADLLDLSDNSGTVLSQFDSGGNLGVRTTDFSEIVPTGGTCRFVVGAAVSGQRMGYQPIFGGFLACTDGTTIAYVAAPQSGNEGLVLGTYSAHNVTIRTGNVSYSRFLQSGVFYTSSYANPSPAPVEMITGIFSSASTSVINNVTCSRFDGAGGAAGGGIGAGHVFRVNTSTTFGVICAQIAGYWGSPTHATRVGGWMVTVYDAAGSREGIRVETDGSQPMLGFYGVNAVARQVLATGAGHTVDDVITALQNLGLVKQS